MSRQLPMINHLHDQLSSSVPELLFISTILSCAINRFHFALQLLIKNVKHLLKYTRSVSHSLLFGWTMNSFPLCTWCLLLFLCGRKTPVWPWVGNPDQGLLPSDSAVSLGQEDKHSEALPIFIKIWLETNNKPRSASIGISLPLHLMLRSLGTVSAANNPLTRKT